MHRKKKLTIAVDEIVFKYEMRTNFKAFNFEVTVKTFLIIYPITIRKKLLNFIIETMC